MSIRDTTYTLAALTQLAGCSGKRYNALEIMAEAVGEIVALTAERDGLAAKVEELRRLRAADDRNLREMVAQEDEFHASIRGLRAELTTAHEENKRLIEEVESLAYQSATLKEERATEREEGWRDVVWKLEPLMHLVNSYNGESGCDCLKIVNKVLLNVREISTEAG